MNMRHAINNGFFDLLLDPAGCLCHMLYLPVLFFNHSTGALPGPAVCPGPLASHRQTATVPDTTIGAQIHQSLDVHRDITPQVTFQGIIRHLASNPVKICLTQLLDTGCWIDTGSLAYIPGSGITDPVDIGQSNNDMLVIGDIDTCYTGHGLSLSCSLRVRYLALALLVLGIAAANHTHDALAPDYAAIPAEFLH